VNQYQLKKTAIAVAAAQFALLAAGAAMAQTQATGAAAAPAAVVAAEAQGSDAAVVVVTGQRAALQSAQNIKRNSDEIVDSIVADDIGKLPDRSVTEVLQRVVGVAIDRTMAKGDPEHYSVEGSGVTIRGLTYVRSELNGRDSFSANGGRSLNFEDVPPELMAGVDVYKNPSAEQIEGSIGGLVNLRTALPFDFKGPKLSLSADYTYNELGGKKKPGGSVMASNRWKTPYGEFGALIDLAYSESATRTDAFQVEPYYPRNDIVNGKTVWVPKGAQWRTLEFDRKREGYYGALQWQKDSTLKSHLTYFKSKYQMQWDERAIFSQASPYNIRVSPDATYGPNGNLLTGTMTDPADGGINFGGDTRTANRKSDTTDIGWNITWRPADRWTLKSDLQYIKAKTHSFDSTVATGVQMAKEKVDLTGDVPRLIFDQSDLAYLADPKNYYWAFTMEHLDRAKATGKSWKGDAIYDFEDHPFLKDIRFGVRLSDKDSVTMNSNPSYNWSPISQTWQLGWDINKLASLGDPRFSGNTELHTFSNFFNSNMAVPSLVFPSVSLANGYPDSYAALHKYHDILCAEAHGGSLASCAPWTAATFGTDPAGTNDQSEKSKAFYTQVRFGFDDLKYPIDGNLGVRYVKTDMTAHGYTTFTPSINIPSGNTVTGQKFANIPAFKQAQDFENDYHNVLPSLNLRMKASDQLQFRFGFAGAMSRPDFSQLQAYTTLSQTADITNNGAVTTVNSVNQSGEAQGNPKLKPITSKQTDVTAEWYFSPVGSFTVAVFNKQLKDVIINQTFNFQIPDVAGNMQNFAVTGPVNGAKGHARGIELAYQQYFDKLPGWMSGLGLQANYTYVDSKQKLYSPVFSAYCNGSGQSATLNTNMNGCDTNGQTFNDLPLPLLSKNAYNLALLYDKGPWSARLAYSWRSKNLQAVNVNGTNGGDATDTNPNSPTFGQHVVRWALPTWADSYGTLDASVFYQVNEKMSIGFEGTNLTDAKYRQLMQQHTGLMGRAWFVSGPRYSVKMRYSF
jgi:TonB-dependent receptor